MSVPRHHATCLQGNIELRRCVHAYACDRKGADHAYILAPELKQRSCHGRFRNLFLHLEIETDRSFIRKRMWLRHIEKNSLQDYPHIRFDSRRFNGDWKGFIILS